MNSATPLARAIRQIRRAIDQGGKRWIPDFMSAIADEMEGGHLEQRLAMAKKMLTIDRSENIDV